MKNTTQQSLKEKWAAPIDRSGEFHSAKIKQKTISNVAAFSKITIRQDISRESSACRRFS